MLRKKIMTAILGMALVVPAWAQNCDTKQPEVSPMSRFVPDDKGALKDTKLNKTWLRCVAGMHWDGKSCSGQSLSYSWKGALEIVADMNAKKVAGRSNWRLPTIEELESIAEKRCFKPAINLEAFPYSPDTAFWSDTRSEGAQPRAWVIHFLNGNRYVANKKQDWRVRLIAD